MRASLVAAAYTLGAAQTTNYTILNNTRCFQDVGQYHGVSEFSQCEDICMTRAGAPLFSYCAPGPSAPSCAASNGTCWCFPLSAITDCSDGPGWISGYRSDKPACGVVQRGTDATNAVRCANFPNGVAGVELDSCCAICSGDPTCRAVIWSDGTKPDPSGSNCWPLSAFGSTQPGAGRDFVLAAPTPTPPPPPASWVPRIAAGDMLYAPDDAAVPRQLMPEVGNGFIATQVMTDSIWVAGIFNGYLTTDPSHRARVPATNVVPAPGQPSAAALDVREATYFRRSWLDPSPPGECTNASTTSCSNAPARIFIEQRWYAHRALPSLLVMEVQVLPPGDNASSSPNAPSAVAASASPPFAMLRLVNAPGAPSGDIAFASVPLPPGLGYTVVNGSTRTAETATSGLQAVCVLTTDLPPSGAFAVSAASPYATAAFLTIIRTSIETAAGDLVAAAQADYASASALAAQGTLRSTHVAEWAETVWTSGFETDRFDAARAINSSLYSIISSVRADRPFGIGPGGLTNAYNGHSFWDTESWMWPSINTLHPDVSQSLLQYRFDRISGAKEKAASYTPPYNGTMFPWESALTGTETCPSWAPTGLHEMHINSDIAFAVWQFWRTLLDDSGGWLEDIAWPLLDGIATFWMSKLGLDNEGAAPGAALHVLNVIGPDEGTGLVNDSAFTNAGVIGALTRAAAVGALLDKPPATLASWLDAAARVVIPYDAELRYHPEYAGYKRGTAVGGIDVVLLGFPLDLAGTVGGADFTRETQANDLNYYATVTSPGLNAMTFDMFAVGYIELGAGYEAAAAKYTNRSFADVQPPFDVWTEVSGGTPNFLTGAGACLETAFFGYTGLRFNDANATLRPTRPAEITSRITLRGVAYRGNRLDVAIDFSAGTLSVTAVSQPSRAFAAAVDEAGYPPSRLPLSLAPREPLSRRSQRGRIMLARGVVPPRALELVDDAGVVHALAPGDPVVLAVQPVTIRAAA